MPDLVLHPRVAPAGTLRVWLGLFDADAAPADIAWRLDGATVTADAVRPLSPAHDHGARSFAGIFDPAFPAAPGVRHRIEARVAGSEPAELIVRPVPDSIPDDDWLRILLTSCYHQAEDRSGLAGRTCRAIPPAERPDLAVLMGDQVYLDLPTLKNFPDDEADLAEKFEDSYRTNWRRGGGLTDILDAAPSISCPDDHEYWNNFPHRSPFIQNSWKTESRTRWKNAADHVYDAFQLAVPAVRGGNIVIDVDPLSVIVLDQRSKRLDNRTASLAPGGLEQLNAWVDDVIEAKKFGAVVTGQSLLDKPMGSLKGRVADWMLANYDDYEGVVKALERLAEEGRPVLLLTGDVHWGRVTTIKRGDRIMFHEIICSPTSLVSTVGSDQLKSLGAGFRRFFGGTPDPWPRHADPLDPEPFFAREVFGKRYVTKALHKQKGDQMAMLALRRASGALRARVTYYEISQTPKRPVEVNLPLLG